MKSRNQDSNTGTTSMDIAAYFDSQDTETAEPAERDEAAGADEVSTSDFRHRQHFSREGFFYLKEIAKFKKLKHEELLTLVRDMRAGDVHARQRLIEANLQLVVSVVKRHLTDPRMSFLDLVQEGNQGLMRAIDLFDPEAGNRFSTYAVPWIRQHITRAMMNKADLIRKPLHVQVKAKSLYARAAAADRAGETVNAESLRTELAQHVEHCGAEIFFQATGIESIEAGASVSGDDGEEGAASLIDALQYGGPDPEESYAHRQTLGLLFKALAVLEGKEQTAVSLVYGLNSAMDRMTLQEAGEQMQLSRERVRQLATAGFQKLIAELRVISGGLENLSIDLTRWAANNDEIEQQPESRVLNI